MKRHINYQGDVAILVRLINQFYDYDFGPYLSASLGTYCITPGVDVVKLRWLINKYPIPRTKLEQQAWKNLKGVKVIRPGEEFRKAYHRTTDAD